MWPLIRVLPVNTHFPFVKFAKYASTISIILIVASLVSLWKPGLNLGIEFKGGSRVEMNTPGKPLDFKLVRTTLDGIGLKDVTVQAVGGAAGKAPSPNSAQVSFESPQGRDPGIAMTQVLLFVWFRFRLSFGLGAVAALFHDVILTFGLIVLLRLEFTLDVIAAILTIIGYSMNDTVVVFDRLRENLRKYKKMPLREVIDLSVNETLSRTVITGLTAVLALAGLAVFGGESLFPMAVALLFGIVVGTYSSIYIASPIVLLWGIKRGEDEDKAKPIDWTPSMRSGSAPQRR